jgi:hypothetical protein
MEVTKWLKPSISVSRIGDSASVQAATRVNAEQSSHDEGLVKGSYYGDIEISPVSSVSKVQAHLRDTARFRARSTSHAVAALSSCTKIPLLAGRAQEDENHSRKRHFRPRFATVRLPGSARTDQVLGDGGIRLVYSLSNLHRSAFDNNAGGHIFPERDQELSRQCHDGCLAQAAAVAAHPFVKPDAES